MTPDEVNRLDFLFGEVHALKSFTIALIGTNPDPQMLLRDVEASFQAGLATIESTEVPDTAVEGYQWAANELRIAVRKRVGS